MVNPKILPPLYAALEHHADASPKRWAVRTRERWLTYAELDRYVNTVAHHLHAVAPPGSFVMQLTHDGANAVIAAYALQKAACCRVPMDARLPAAAKAALADQLDAAAWITDPANEQDARALCGCKPLIVVDHAAIMPTRERPRVETNGETPIFLASTSGSQGAPKFMLRRQRHYRDRMDTEMGLEYLPTDRALSFSALSTGLGGLHFTRGLYRGATLDWLDVHSETPETIMRWISENGVNVLLLTPSFARALLGAWQGDPLPGIRLMIFGTEPLLQADLEMLKRRIACGTTFINAYGAMEIGLIAKFCADHDTTLTSAFVPVGKALSDVELFIADDSLRPLPAGETGEIIARNRFAMGYWNAPNLTAEKFVPDPLDPAYTLYRTGDFGKVLPDGNIVQVGRRDWMVKIRGFRVELNPIENAIRLHPSIADAALKMADAHEDGGAARLIAYLVPRTGAEVRIPELRACLARTLPDFMIPAQFVTLDALPRLVGGKVNMAALVPPAHDTPITTTGFTLTELRLLPLWREALPVKQFGRGDHFFDLGGDSLRAMQMITHINAALKLNLSPAALYQHPTLAGLAAHIDAGSPVLSALVGLNPYGSKPILVGVSGHNGYAMHYRRLCGTLGYDYPFYAFQYPRYDPRVPKFESLHNLAAHYVAHMGRELPAGKPFYLIGASVGGLIALEMARQLTAAGSPPRGVILLDTMLMRADAAQAETSLGHLRRALFAARRDLLKRIRANAKERANLRVRSEIAGLARHYRPTPYAGRLILFSSRREAHADANAQAWKRLALGEFTRIDLEAEHELLTDAHVTETARQVRRILDA